MIKIKQITQTHTGKAFIIMWLLILAIFISVPTISFFRGELLGNISLSTLPIAILINISIILAYKIKHDSLTIAKVGWIILSVVIVVYALVLTNPLEKNAGEEAGMIIAYPMATLSFPSCFLILYLYYGIARLCDILGFAVFSYNNAISFYLVYLIFWFGFFMAGYMQWFKLLPLIIEKLQNKGTK